MSTDDRPATWPAAIAGFTTWMRAAGRPTSSIRLRRHQLARLAEFAGGSPWEVGGETIVAWLAARDWAPETKRSHRAAATTFYAWAVRAGHLAADPTLSVPAVRPGLHMARPAPDDAVDAAMRAGDDRVRLMVELASRCGMRRGEIARAASWDLVADPGGVSIVAHGKGGKDRLIPAPGGLGARLSRLPAGWWFPGHIEGHLSPARVGELVSGVLPDGWTCHTLRHRFATRAYWASHDLLAVQDLLGHASPTTTRLYVLPDAQGLRAVVEAAA